jgi:hypothetical protein
MVYGSIHMSAIRADDLELFKAVLATGVAFIDCSELMYLHRIYFRFSNVPMTNTFEVLKIFIQIHPILQ